MCVYHKAPASQQIFIHGFLCVGTVLSVSYEIELDQ